MVLTRKGCGHNSIGHNYIVATIKGCGHNPIGHDDMVSTTQGCGHLVTEDALGPLLCAVSTLFGTNTICCQHYLVPTLFGVNTAWRNTLRCQRPLVPALLGASRPGHPGASTLWRNTSECHYLRRALSGHECAHAWVVHARARMYARAGMHMRSQSTKLASARSTHASQTRALT